MGFHSWKEGATWDVSTVASKGNAESAEIRSLEADKFARDIRNFIWAATVDGKLSVREIAAYLNERGLTTPRGGQWSAVQVKRVKERSQPFHS